LAEDVHPGLSQGGLNLAGVLPLYEINSTIVFDFQESNAGLWYDKFCSKWCMDPSREGLKRWSMESFESINPKMDWISSVVRKGNDTKRVGSKSLLNEFRARRERFLKELVQKPIYLKTVGPFVTGLGRNHPVENGFAWHHTLGVPYLPGSSIKGVVRSWALSWHLQPKDDIIRIFGPRDSKDHSVGSVIFLDALPIKPVQLKVDIITPHYGPYYQDEGQKPPADWYSPIPVPFLAVDSDQEFIFGLIPRRSNNPKDIDDCSKANEWLVDALKDLGAGAKTSVGYGRFERFDPR
jgi:CRISPR-associated protein Cmr6